MSESYTVEAILTAVDRSFSSTLTRAGSAIQTFSSNASKVTSNIGKGMIVAGAAISAVGKSSLSSFGTFDANLNKAAVVAGGTAKDIKGLSDVANKMGKDLPISANEAAQAMVAMAQNGASVGDIKKQFPAIAQAATAAGADLTTTAGVVQQAMNVWGESLESPNQAAAILTKSANLSNASIESMQQALSTIGSTANIAGVDLSTTSTAIGLLTNTGMSSAQAAQDLNHAMLQMLAPSDTAKKAMDSLGLSFVDSQGKMKPFKQILDETNQATEGMSDAQRTAALKAIFHTSGLQAMLPLLKAVKNHSKDTSVSWDAYKQSLDGVSDSTQKSTEYLSKSAEEMQKNVGSKLEQVGGSWEALRNKSFEASSGITSKLLQNISDHITWASESDSAIAKVIRGFVGLSPVIGPATIAVGSFLTSAGKIGSVVGQSVSALGNFGRTALVIGKAASSSESARQALATLAGESRIAAAAQWVLNASFLGFPLVWIIGAVVALAGIFIYLWNTNEQFRNGIITGWNAIVSAVQPAIQAISNVLSSVFGVAMEFWKAHSEGIINGVKLAFQGFALFFQGVWDAIVGVIQIAMGIISGVINTIMAVVQGDWSGAWQAIKAAADLVWQGIQTLVSGVLGIISGIIVTGLGVIMSTWTAIWGVVSSVFTTVWNVIVTVATAIWNGIQAAFNAFVNFISNVWNSALTNIQAIATSIWTGISSFIQSVITGISNIISSVCSFISSAWSSFLNGISSIANSVWSSIQSFISSAISAISSIISSTCSVISSIWNGMLSALLSIASSIWSGIQSLISNAINAAKNIVINAGNAMKSGFVNALNAMKGSVSGVINGVKSILHSLTHINLSTAGSAIMNSFLGGLKAAWGAVTSFVGGIAGWIKAHKGPISYDRKLLIPAGRAIMGGFNAALQSGFEDVQGRVRGMAGSLQNEFNANVTSSNRQAYEINQNNQPAQITLSLGSRDFTAFVEDISAVQNRRETIRLKTASL